MKTILYCRVSSDEQAKGASLEVQEAYLRSYCANHNYEIVGVYKDDYSAKHFDLQRPEFKKMYDYCRKNKKLIDKVLFLRWDRYSRNLEFALTYKRKFIDEMGIEINAIESPIDFSGTEWSMMLGMYCGVAHTEDEKISRRTKECTHKKRMQGHCTNKAPRGYKNVRVDEHNTHAEIDEPKARMVRKAFEEVAKGVETPCRIRRRLFPSVAESSFFDMLRNPFYIGKIRVPAYGSDPEMIVEGKHEGIITEELFYKVQDILNAKKKAPKLSKKINPDLFLRKFLVCPICGHALTGAESRGNGGKYAYYNCCHDAKHLRKRAEIVNEGFAKYVGSLKPNETVLKLYENILEDIRKEQIADSLSEVEQLKTKMETFKQRIQRAKDLYLDGEMSKAEKDEAVNHNQKQLDELQNKVDVLEMGNRSKIKPKLDYSISLINNMERYIVDAPVETKIKLISSMFPEKIKFDGEKYRTNSYNHVLDLIYQETKQLREGSVKKKERSDLLSNSVPRPGIEPGWIAPLVFETSASTDSAIWANSAWLICGCKGTNNF